MVILAINRHARPLNVWSHMAILLGSLTEFFFKIRPTGHKLAIWAPIFARNASQNPSERLWCVGPSSSRICSSKKLEGLRTALNGSGRPALYKCSVHLKNIWSHMVVYGHIWQRKESPHLSYSLLHLATNTDKTTQKTTCTHTHTQCMAKYHFSLQSVLLWVLTYISVQYGRLSYFVRKCRFVDTLYTFVVRRSIMCHTIPHWAQ